MTLIRPRTSLDRVLAALAEPTRRAIFEQLLEQPGQSTAELAERHSAISRWGVMKHLEVLRTSGLVQTMAAGRMRRHYPERSALEPLRSWLGDR